MVPNMFKSYSEARHFMGGRGRRITVQGWSWAKVRPDLKKQTKARKIGHMAQVVECLPSKLKALSSNPLYTEKKVIQYL
jgi:hypothetical protein